MLETGNDANGRPTLRLPEIVDLILAQDLKSVLYEALSRGAGLTVDAGEVERITTPPLQVLAAASVEFSRAGGAAMVFAGASPNFARAVTMLALGETLRLPEMRDE